MKMNRSKRVVARTVGEKRALEYFSRRHAPERIRSVSYDRKIKQWCCVVDHTIYGATPESIRKQKPLPRYKPGDLVSLRKPMKVWLRRDYHGPIFERKIGTDAKARVIYARYRSGRVFYELL